MKPPLTDSQKARIAYQAMSEYMAAYGAAPGQYDEDEILQSLARAKRVKPKTRQQVLWKAIALAYESDDVSGFGEEGPQDPPENNGTSWPPA